MNHSFSIEYAQKYGIEEAVLIENFAFWINHNRANKKNIKEIEIDGKKEKRTFTFNSASALTELFPYMNAKKIYRVVDSLLEQKVLIRKYFNTNTYNRTSWFCFVDENQFLKTGIPFPEKEKSISRKQEMDLPKTGNHDTDINTDNKQHIEELKILSLTEQLKALADKNKLTYSINANEQRLFQNKLTIEMSLTNEQILEQANRFFEIVKRDPKLNWIHAYSFGFKFLQFNWDKIQAWHNVNKPKVPVKVAQSFMDKKPKQEFSSKDLEKMAGFLN